MEQLMEKNIIIKEDPSAAAQAAVELITRGLNSSQREYHLAISGGGTALLLFQALLKQEMHGKNLNKLRLWWVDERCVAPDDSESNYGHALKNLVHPLGIPEEQLYRIQGEGDPAEEAARYAALLKERLPERNRLPVLDMIFLGMGEDGHTASVFPDDWAIFSSDAAVETARHPQCGQQRITLTPACINNAGLIFFLITGSGKAGTLERVLFSRIEPPLPAGRISPTQGRLIWIIDSAAAGRLE